MNIYESIDLIEDPRLKESCLSIPRTKEFLTHPASTGIHHGRIGGLLDHTLEVVEYALHIAKAFPQTNHDVLVSASLWHDYAKIWDYKLTTFFAHQYNELPKYYVLKEESFGCWKKVYVADHDYKNQIHHITGSVAEFTAAAKIAGIDRKTIQDIQHCIIAHHGPVKEWGSIKAPQTLEAVILHQADYLSANFGAKK